MFTFRDCNNFASFNTKLNLNIPIYVIGKCWKKGLSSLPLEKCLVLKMKFNKKYTKNIIF